MRSGKKLGLVLMFMALSLALLATIVPAIGWAQEAGGQPAAAAPTVKETSVFQHYFIDGGPIVWFVLLPLSISVVALAVMNGLEIRRANILPPEELAQIHAMLEARQYREVIEMTGASRSMLGYIVHQGLAAAGMGYSAMERALEDAVDEKSANLVRRIEALNIIGNVGPLLGLFGTVVGMIDTFTTIVGAGGVPSAVDLAKGISIALVCTTWGLVVAIPGLAIYGVFRNRIEMLASATASRGQEILGMFRSASSGKAAAPAAAASAGARMPSVPRPVAQPQPNA